MGFSNRNLPLQHIRELVTNIATAFPIFFNGEHKTIRDCAQELQKIFNLYFKNMDYSAVSSIFGAFDPEIYKLCTISYTYINKVMDGEYMQNKYLDWDNSTHKLNINKRPYMSLRAFNLGSQYALILNSCINVGFHEKLIQYFNRIFP